MPEADILGIDAKRQRSLGEAEWRRLAALTGHPGAWRLALVEIGWARLAAGPLLYAVLIALHPIIIGYDPLP